MAGPRELWKTTIVIWTKDDPQKVPVSRLAAVAEGGEGYIGRAHSERVANPGAQEDGPSEEWLEELEVD